MKDLWLRLLLVSVLMAGVALSGSCDGACDGDGNVDAYADTDGDGDVDSDGDAESDVDGELLPCDGGLLDPASGLCWQDPPADDRIFTWEEAMAYCDELDLGGYGQGSWRLPTISELRSLIRGCPETETGGACGVTDDCLDDDDCFNRHCGGCSDSGGYGAEGAYWPEVGVGVVPSFWSSSSRPGSSSYAWGVSFDYAVVSALNKTNNFYVRCVRGGP